MRSYFSSAAAVAAAVLLGSTTTSAYDCPLKRCDYCLPLEIIQAPGVGFELADSYGTASVQHYNRTIDRLALVPGSADYQALLTQLSRSTSVPMQSYLERWRPRLNKSLGRPSTADVGVIAAQLTALRAVTEERLAASLDRVVVTVPQFPALTREDLGDAIEYAGLRSWLEFRLPYPTMLYTPNSAYAGSGRGHCKEWTNIYACREEDEEGEIPSEMVLGVTYTNTTLLASVSRISYAFVKSDDRHSAFPELGHRALASYERPEEYWEKVASRLRRFLDEIQAKGKKITHVILMGEKATEDDFATALKHAFRDGNAQALKQSGMANPTWVASEGAAMYARIRQEVPYHCQEPERCKTERKDHLISDEL